MDLFFSEGNIDAFRFKLVQMNSKAEWHAPVVPRVVVTRELEELEQGGRAGQRGRGRGGGRQQARGRRQRGGA